MTGYIAQGYNSVYSFAKENIFNTPERVIAGRVAAGTLAIATSTVAAVYLEYPFVAQHIRQEMGLTCGRTALTAIQKLPHAYQFVNATALLSCLPSTSKYCLPKLSSYIGRIVLNGFTFSATNFLIRKAFNINFAVKTKNE